MAVVLFALLFYQIQLYSDFVEQIYFLLTGFYGWWFWVRTRKKKAEGDVGDVKVEHLKTRGITMSVLVIVGGTLAMGYFMSKIHIIFPEFFPIAAAFPFLDAFTTIMILRRNCSWRERR